MPQLLLQPRGGQRDRGPQNYERSVIRGIRLAEITSELGPDLPVLRRLYPDNIARLWGSTPTDQVNNAKVRALRDRRVGDHVLFYAEKGLYARARILHLFRNPAVAKRVWQTDDEGRTWEHVMALGDVEQFNRPVPAEPVLRALGLPVPLRSLTLIGAADYTSIMSLLPDLTGAVSPSDPPASPRTSRKHFFRAMQKLIDVARGDAEDPAGRNLLLALLWAVGRTAADANGSGRSADAGSLTMLLDRYGMAPAPGRSARVPTDQLVESGLWGGPAPEAWEFDASGFHGWPTRRKPGIPAPGFAPAIAELLDDVEVRGRAVAMLSRALAPDLDREALLAQVGLAGYDTATGALDLSFLTPGVPSSGGPVERRAVKVDRIVRSSRHARDVKRLHGHRCQICGLRLETRDGYYSEAAHIRGLGKPHDGTDELSNLLCLCPNHHTLFDFFALYIDEEFTVRRTSDDTPIGELRRHPQHDIDRRHLRHHRRFCGLPK
ncbi:HNH endonuclease [Micromonospora sp. NPDC051141]|uniref:HNH endonuclease n=1 Tax=Micromonospora sp. NPDC051141 TaxID=3364284 RepID=UPI0037983FBE